MRATGARTAKDSDEALNAIIARRPNLIFLDIWLERSKLDGLQLLDVIKRDHPDVPVVMISGHGTIETAVAAIKQGAYDFIEKPFNADRLLLGRRSRAGDAAAEARGARPQAALAGGAVADRPLDGDEPAAPDHREGGADQ